jgi:hypothetical protein
VDLGSIHACVSACGARNGERGSQWGAARGPDLHFTRLHVQYLSFLYMAYTLGGRDCARFSADKSFGVLRECDSPQEV